VEDKWTGSPIYVCFCPCFFNFIKIPLFRKTGKEFRKTFTMEYDREESDDDTLPPPSPPTTSSPTQAPPKKKNKVSKTAEKSRFPWTPEMVEQFIDCLNEQKTQFEFKGLDFEADLVRLYTNVRTMMAKIY
jgi:hypothetical protein